MIRCYKCGEPFIVENDVPHHITSDGKVDNDRDADHSPYRTWKDGDGCSPTEEET